MAHLSLADVTQHPLPQPVPARSLLCRSDAHSVASHAVAKARAAASEAQMAAAAAAATAEQVCRGRPFREPAHLPRTALVCEVLPAFLDSRSQALFLPQNFTTVQPSRMCTSLLKSGMVPVLFGMPACAGPQAPLDVCCLKTGKLDGGHLNTACTGVLVQTAGNRKRRYSDENDPPCAEAAPPASSEKPLQKRRRSAGIGTRRKAPPQELLEEPFHKGSPESIPVRKPAAALGREGSFVGLGQVPSQQPLPIVPKAGPVWADGSSAVQACLPTELTCLYQRAMNHDRAVVQCAALLVLADLFAEVPRGQRLGLWHVDDLVGKLMHLFETQPDHAGAIGEVALCIRPSAALVDGMHSMPGGRFLVEVLLQVLNRGDDARSLRAAELLGSGLAVSSVAGCSGFLYTNDARVLLEILLRELPSHVEDAHARHAECLRAALSACKTLRSHRREETICMLEDCRDAARAPAAVRLKCAEALALLA